MTHTGTFAQLNEDALKFLELCDGTNTIEDVTNTLAKEYPEDPEVKEMARTFLDQLKEKNLIEFAPEKTREPRKIHPEADLFTPLQNVYIECTNACNLRCLHCYNNSGPKPENELTTEEIKKIIDETAKLHALNIIFTGGEPFVREDIFELMEYTRRKPMSVIMFTNGFLMNEEAADRIKNLEILRILVSLDGARPETHDKFRGVPGAFQRTKKAIKLLTERGVNVTIDTCINRLNKEEIPQILQLIKDLGAKEYIMGPMYSAGRAEKRIDDYGITFDEYQRLVKPIREWEKKVFGMDKVSVRPNPLSNCGIGMRSIVIKADGTFIPCTSADPQRFSLGNVRKDSIKKVWNNSITLNEIRKIDLGNNKKCRECTHFSYCKGGCRLTAYQALGDVTLPDPTACIYYCGIAADISMATEESQTISFEVR
jgi:radical SAM protein with 4Fe4S-binding SPASM domain